MPVPLPLIFSGWAVQVSNPPNSGKKIWFGSSCETGLCVLWWKGMWWRQKSPAPGAGEQLGWAGRKEVPASTGRNGGGNTRLSLSCVSSRNSFRCFLFFLQSEEIVITFVQICLLSLKIRESISLLILVHKHIDAEWTVAAFQLPVLGFY